jgi:hypothetical protein
MGDQTEERIEKLKEINTRKMKENVIDITELHQDVHNFNKGTETGGGTDAKVIQGARSRPFYSY